MKVRITDISKQDAFYEDRKMFIGKTIDYLGCLDMPDCKDNGFVNGYFLLDGDKHKRYFAGFKYEPVPEYSIEFPGGTMNQDGTVCKEPSAMNELGKYDTFADWLNGRFGYQSPKKLTWLQKIRDYDKIESMLSEALHDRDLHATVADNWQAKLVKSNKENEQLGAICKYLLDYLDSMDKKAK